MYQRHDKQYDSKTSLPPERVFRQELVTWAETDNGFVRTVLTRYFGQNGQREQGRDNYTHETRQPLATAGLGRRMARAGR